MSGQQHAPAAIYPRERPGTHSTGGWVGPWTVLEGRKIHQGSILDHPARSSVAIPTELPGPQEIHIKVYNVVAFHPNADSTSSLKQRAV